MKHEPTEEDRELNIFSEGPEDAPEPPADEDEDVRIYRPRRATRAETATWEETQTDTTFYAEESPEQSARYYEEDVHEAGEEIPEEPQPARRSRRRGLFAALFGGLRRNDRADEEELGYAGDTVGYDDGDDEPVYAETEEIPDDIYDGNYEEEPPVADRQAIEEILDDFWKNFQDPAIDAEPIAVETPEEAEAYSRVGEKRSPVEAVFDELSRLRGDESEAGEEVPEEEAPLTVEEELIEEEEEPLTVEVELAEEDEPETEEEVPFEEPEAAEEEQPESGEEEPAIAEEPSAEAEEEPDDQPYEEAPEVSVFDILHEYATGEEPEQEGGEAESEGPAEAEIEPEEEEMTPEEPAAEFPRRPMGMDILAALAIISEAPEAERFEPAAAEPKEEAAEYEEAEADVPGFFWSAAEAELDEAGEIEPLEAEALEQESEIAGTETVEAEIEPVEVEAAEPEIETAEAWDAEPETEAVESEAVEPQIEEDEAENEPLGFFWSAPDLRTDVPAEDDNPKEVSGLLEDEEPVEFIVESEPEEEAEEPAVEAEPEEEPEEPALAEPEEEPEEPAGEPEPEEEAEEPAAEEALEEPAAVTAEESALPAYSLDEILAEFADWDLEPEAGETPAEQQRSGIEEEPEEPAEEPDAEEAAEEIEEEPAEEPQRDWRTSLARAFSGIVSAFRPRRAEEPTDAQEDEESAAETAAESTAVAVTEAAAVSAAAAEAQLPLENGEDGIKVEIFEEEPAEEPAFEAEPEEPAEDIEVEIFEEEPAEEPAAETEPEEPAEDIEVEVFEEEPAEEPAAETEPEEPEEDIEVEIFEEEPSEEPAAEAEPEEPAEDIEVEIFEEEPSEEPAAETEPEDTDGDSEPELEPEEDSAFLAAIAAMTGLPARAAQETAAEGAMAETQEETVYSVRDILAEHSSWLSTDALPEEENSANEPAQPEEPAEAEAEAEETLAAEEEPSEEDAAQAQFDEPAAETPSEPEELPAEAEEEPAYRVKDILSEFHSWWESEEEPAAPTQETEEETPSGEELPLEEAPDGENRLPAQETLPAEEAEIEETPQIEEEPAEEEPTYSVKDILSEFHNWWEPEEEPAVPEQEAEEPEAEEETPVGEEPEAGEVIGIEEEIPPAESSEREQSAASWYQQYESEEPEPEEPASEEPEYKVSDILQDFHSWWEPEAAENPVESEPDRGSEEEEIPSEHAAEPEIEAELEEEPAEAIVLPYDADDTVPTEPEETLDIELEEPAFRVDEILEDVRSWEEAAAKEARSNFTAAEAEPIVPQEEPEEEPVQQIAQEPAIEAEAAEVQSNNYDAAEPDFDVDAILNEYRARWGIDPDERTYEEPEEEAEEEPATPARVAAEAFASAAYTEAAEPAEEYTEEFPRGEQAEPASSGSDTSLSELLASLWEEKPAEQKPAAAPKAAQTAAGAAALGAAAKTAAAAAGSAAVTASVSAVGGISRMEEEARRLMAGIELDGDDEEDDEAPKADPFHIGPTYPTEYSFGGRTVDVGPDDHYVPSALPRRPVEEESEAETVSMEEEEDRPRFRLFRKKQSPSPAARRGETAHTQEIDDAAGELYAPDRDYPSGEQPEEEAFPSFGQYLLGLVSGLLVRVRGISPNAATATVSADNEDLGPEVAPAAASRYYGSFIHSLRLRFLIGIVLMVAMTWITIGLPVSGALRSVRIAAGMALGIQLTVMLLSLDVITGAAVNLARGRFGADSLAVISCILTSFDALVVLLGAFGTPHMPLCLISSLSLLGVLFSSLLSARSLRKATRVPAIGKRCYAVTGESNLKGKGITLLKSLRPAKGFVRRAEESVPDEMLFNRVSLLFVVVALILSVVVAIAQKAGSELLYIASAILAPAAPLTALLCFALPYFVGTMRIFPSGAAIAGWSGLSDIGQSQNLIITDRDLFPEGSVSVDSVRIFADIPPEKVISYAGTMITASGSCLAPCFAELMSRNGGTMYPVENFEYLSGGGMKGIIGGEVVLCGSVELMRLMNVRVPYRLVGKTTVLLAVDGLLYGIFNMKYEAQNQVRDALIGLIRSNRHPVFAIRDFNVTPELIRSIFNVSTDGYDFPPYVERFAISEARTSRDSKIAAVVCREGLGPLVHMADTGRSMFMATRINLLVTLLSAVIGIILVFVRLLSVGTIGAGFLLLYMLVWALPVFVVSFLLKF